MRNPALLPAILCSILAAAPALADSPSTGVWQKHVYSFAFMGFTSTYSCDGLADKLKILLLAAGARADVKANGGACASGYGRPDKLARADLTFYTLAPPTGTTADGTPVDAQWLPVDLQVRKPRELGLGDCELVDQFRTSVLPLFTTRNIDNHTTCVPHQESGSIIGLKFESLSGVPKSHS
jgi:hypothetical protein